MVTPATRMGIRLATKGGASPPSSPSPSDPPLSCLRCLGCWKVSAPSRVLTGRPRLPGARWASYVREKQTQYREDEHYVVLKAGNHCDTLWHLLRDLIALNHLPCPHQAHTLSTRRGAFS